MNHPPRKVLEAMARGELPLEVLEWHLAHCDRDCWDIIDREQARGAAVVSTEQHLAYLRKHYHQENK